MLREEVEENNDNEMRIGVTVTVRGNKEWMLKRMRKKSWNSGGKKKKRERINSGKLEE